MNRSEINLHLGDSLEAMKLMPDNAYDLAIVDPPYGIGESGGVFRDRKGGGHRVLQRKEWDNATPTKEYFNELQRVSINQIIWGGNYFTDKVPVSRCWLYWDKLMGGDFSDGELAWTSFDKVLKKFTKCNKDGGKIHPTQKHVKLYEWLLTNYAKEGDKILDTHGGSMSIAIACHNLKFNLDLWELDEDYYKAGVKRFEQHKKQLQLF